MTKYHQETHLILKYQISEHHLINSLTANS